MGVRATLPVPSYFELQKLNFDLDQLLRCSNFKTEVSEFAVSFERFTETARSVPTWLASPAAEFHPRLNEWLQLGLEKPLQTKFASEVLFEHCNSLLQFVWIAMDSDGYDECAVEHGFADESVCKQFPQFGLESMEDVQCCVNAWARKRSIDSSQIRAGLSAEKLFFSKNQGGRPKGVMLSKWENEALMMLSNGTHHDDVDTAMLKRKAKRFSGYRTVDGKKLSATEQKPNDWQRGDAKALIRAYKKRTK